MSEVARKQQASGLVRSLRSGIQKQVRTNRGLEEFAPKTVRVRAESNCRMMVAAEKPHGKQFSRRVFDAVFTFQIDALDEFHTTDVALDTRGLKAGHWFFETFKFTT